MSFLIDWLILLSIWITYHCDFYKRERNNFYINLVFYKNINVQYFIEIYMFLPLLQKVYQRVVKTFSPDFVIVLVEFTNPTWMY